MYAPEPPPWLAIAAAEIGVAAFAAGASNPRITEYHALTNIRGCDDKASWCSSFVNGSLDRAGLCGTGSALARSWLRARGARAAALLGGNQLGAVREQRHPRAAVLGYRWPAAATA